MCNYLKIHPLVKDKKSLKGYSIFSSGGHLVQWNGTYNYFKIHKKVKAEKSFKGFSIFSSGGHFVQRSGKV